VRARREAQGIADLWPSFATPHPRFFRAQPGGTRRNFIQPIVTRRLQGSLCCAARAPFRLKFATTLGRARETSINRPQVTTPRLTGCGLPAIIPIFPHPLLCPKNPMVSRKGISPASPLPLLTPVRGRDEYKLCFTRCFKRNDRIRALYPHRGRNCPAQEQSSCFLVL